MAWLNETLVTIRSQESTKMGTISKRNGKFQAQVRREGVKPIRKTFHTKKDAKVWVRSIETRIDAGEVNLAMPKLLTLRDLLVRYADEITHYKKGKPQELRRISRLLKDRITDTQLSKLSSATIAEFRDRRMKDGVLAAQIDLILICHAIKIARLEWGVELPTNPVEGVRIPNGVVRRTRRLESGEYEALSCAAAKCTNTFIWPCIEIAIETGMRRSEILSLQWDNIDLEARIALLADTKNGSSREVPLTIKAVQVLTVLERQHGGPRRFNYEPGDFDITAVVSLPDQKVLFFPGVHQRISCKREQFLRSDNEYASWRHSLTKLGFSKEYSQ